MFTPLQIVAILFFVPTATVEFKENKCYIRNVQTVNGKKIIGLDGKNDTCIVVLVKQFEKQVDCDELKLDATPLTENNAYMLNENGNGEFLMNNSYSHFRVEGASCASYNIETKKVSPSDACATGVKGVSVACQYTMRQMCSQLESLGQNQAINYNGSTRCATKHSAGISVDGRVVKTCQRNERDHELYHPLFCACMDKVNNNEWDQWSNVDGSCHGQETYRTRFRKPPQGCRTYDVVSVTEYLPCNRSQVTATTKAAWRRNSSISGDRPPQILKPSESAPEASNEEAKGVAVVSVTFCAFGFVFVVAGLALAVRSKRRKRKVGPLGMMSTRHVTKDAGAKNADRRVASCKDCSVSSTLVVQKETSLCMTSKDGATKATDKAKKTCP